MEWSGIIIALLGTVSLVDLVRVIFFHKEDKHDKQAETKDKEVETLRKANDMLEHQLGRSHETIMALNKENSNLHEQNASLRATQSCLFDDMCVHKGCRLRKPHQGQGALWYENYRNDPSLGADYDSIDTLIKRERSARLKAEMEGKNEDYG